MKMALVIIGTLSLVVAIIVLVVMDYNFRANCGDYLKLAGDAPTIQKAQEFLGLALDYIQKRELTHGNTALLFKTPRNDVGIWYQQIVGAQATLSQLLGRVEKDPESVSQLEKDNALMKIREVILDQGKDGTKITKPNFIACFPFKWGMLIWFLLSFGFVVLGLILIQCNM